MKFERIAPESLIAEGVEAKDLLSIFQHRQRVTIDSVIEPVSLLRHCYSLLRSTALGNVDQAERNKNQQGDYFAEISERDPDQRTDIVVRKWICFPSIFVHIVLLPFV